MAVLKSEHAHRDAKQPPPDNDHPTPLAHVMREFRDLVHGFETSLLRSLDDTDATDVAEKSKGRERRREDIRHEACRLAITELGQTYSRKQLRRSLLQAESLGKATEERLHAAPDTGHADSDADLRNIHHGHFRLYSTDLFDMLGQPANLRLGTLRFHSSYEPRVEVQESDSYATTVELALNESFFVADAAETFPYHPFHVPESPSLRNRGILSRKAEDGGAFPHYDSWLLFTFLGNGIIKVEIPIEMCADVYGGNLRGRENEELVFWGMFVEDDVDL